MRTNNPGYDKCKEWYYKKQLETAIEALRKRGFNADYFNETAAVNKTLLEQIPADASIGIPGSVTIRELDIIDTFVKRGNTIYQHWKSGLTEKTDRDDRRLEGTSDYFLTSANAITLYGDIINIDGVGNRVADTIFGPRHVIIIAGINKLVHTIDEGISRSKNIAGVMNAKRVGVNTPCVTTGICCDCHAPRRICRVITIIQYRPFQTKMSVMLVNRILGF